MGVPGHRGAKRAPVAGANYDLGHGDTVIAAITSCTNTSNPFVLVAAGLVARKARALGLSTKPWVKTSLAPGSQVVTDYLDASGLQADLDALGFQTVGYGCTTCIGNSGPLPDAMVSAIEDNKLVASAVLSGNRNSRAGAREHAGELPGLAAAGGGLCAGGHVKLDLTKDRSARRERQPVYLSDIWPTQRR
jgi:aconitate hydratase